MHNLVRSVAALVALMVASLSYAAELIVPTQYPTIQAAINAAVSGDIVTVRPGTYNERLDIGGRNITLRSLLGPTATIIDPQGVGGVVVQSTNAAANGWVLQGFTIRNGLDSGLYVSGVTATVRNCKFINNQASRGGGAHVRAGANVTFEGCEFRQNLANSGEFLGGAMYAESATVLAKLCTFVENSARRPNGGYGNASYLQRGGGIHAASAQVELQDCSSALNTAYMYYENASCFNGASTFISLGGFLSAAGGTVTVLRHQSVGDAAFCKAIDTAGGCGDRTEVADSRGGFLFSDASATVSIRDSLIQQPKAEAIGQGGCCYYNDVYPRGYGGALYLSGASASVSNCTFEAPQIVRTWLGGSGGPQESHGGFIYHEAGSLSIVDTIVRNATAPDFGGAIRTVAGAGLTITGSRFENCVSGNAGGAISASTAAPFTIESTQFLNCRSDAASGGAIWLTGGTRTFTNCTFTNNIAQGGGDHRGGAVYAEGGAQLNFTDCGFTGNEARSTGDSADRTTWGGACAMFGVTPRYTRCTFTNNAAISTGNGGGWRRAHGGATAEYDSDAVFTDCMFMSNKAECVGNGARYSRGGTVHLWNSDSDFVRTSIIDGRALPTDIESRGGGVWMENVSRPGFTYCTIADCDANEGGGLYVTNSEPYLVSTAYRRNLAAAQGGAMLVDSVSTPYVLECAFEQNSAPAGGAVRTLGSGTNLPFIVSSTFCGNTVDAIAGSILGGEGNSIAAECSADCNGNGVPDFTEIANGAPDVDGNGILDACQQDCNANGLPDAYELGQNTVADCNGNGTPDSCDIASGLSVDADSDGTPDECELESARLVPFEYGSITAAINAAQSGDTIFVAPGAYYEKFSFGNKQLTMKSVGGPEVTYIDGNGQNGTLLTINGGQTNTTVIDGFTFWYAQGGYAMYIQNASPTVRNCRFLFNNVSDGAAFRIEAPSSAEIYDCLVESNTANTGGGVWTNANPVFTRTTFKNNTANNSGGAARLQGGSARFVDCDFLGNRAQGGGDHRGGAVSASSTNNASFVACLFENNLATSNGDHADRVAVGGACAFNDCVVSGANPPRTFVDCVFDANTARATGNHGGTRVAIAGAVYDFNSDLSYLRCTFDGNRAETTSNAARRSWAGAMYATASNPDLEFCVFSANAAASNDGGDALGGALYYEGLSNGFIDDTVLTGNSARRGGALYMAGNSQPDVATSDFASNSAAERGGAVYANVAPAFFYECEFRDNSAPAAGGGLMFVEGVTGPIVFASFLCGNSAPIVIGNWGGAETKYQNTILDTCNDCNGNGVDDTVETASGAAPDCDANGVPDTCELDSDADGVIDVCDGCPADPSKSAAGACGCGVPDTDSDSDGVADCNDGCPSDPLKTSPGTCGCGVSDADSDSDGVADCNDGCPNDPLKTSPGTCGCGVSDADSDSDGVADCIDGCPNDPLKTSPGTCGCGASDADSDSDGVADCIDGCPNDPLKTSPGTCGCGVSDADSDSDGVADCNDGCPNDPLKSSPGTCGCGVSDADSDSDGVADCNDGCPSDPLKTSPGTCGCGVSDADSDSDGVADCNDGCPNDPLKTSPGTCGCGVSDADSDSDGVADCNDGCPNDPLKTSPGTCGCGVSDADSDSDGVADCIDNCPTTANPSQADCDADQTGDACETAPDCNQNGVPDSCDLASGVSTDIDSSGVPDECEPVVGGSGYTSIQAAIDAVPAGTEIRVGPGTYTGAISILNKPIHLRSIAGVSATTLSGAGLTQSILTIRNAAAAGSSVTGFRFVDGLGGTAEFSTQLGGAVLLLYTAADIRSCEFIGNTSNYGGAIYAFSYSGTIENCRFEDNHTLEDSGAVQLGFGGNFTFRNNVLVDNSSGRNGGALQVVQWFEGPVTTGSVIDCTFDGNTSVGAGSALAWFAGAGPDLLIDGCVVTSNQGQSAAFAKLADSGVNALAFAMRDSYFCLNAPQNIAGPVVDLGGNTLGSDCNANGVCDIDELAVLDCDSNGTLDSCELATGAADDCDGNGVIDACEIASGAADANANGVPDTCEFARGDFDLDGIVGGGDLAILLSFWGDLNGSVADLTGDGAVTAEDLALLLSLWGG